MQTSSAKFFTSYQFEVGPWKIFFLERSHGGHFTSLCTCTAGLGLEGYLCGFKGGEDEE